jgi:TonB family protein
MKSRRASSTLAVLTALTAVILPLTAMAKPLDNTYTYVGTVFDKLQSQWVTQAIDNRLVGDNQLTFTLNEDGSLNASASHLDGTAANGESTQAVLQFLKANAPFGPFPAGLKGSQLTFKVKISPDTFQMLSYQVQDRNQAEPVVSYVASSVAQPASMFYTRVLPVTPGKVLDKPEISNGNEKAMADYVAQVQQQVRQNWQLPQDYSFQRTVARMMIDRDGTLLGVQLSQSSGDKTVDQAALKAITTAGAFPTVPANVPSLPVTIEYVFEPVIQGE